MKYHFTSTKTPLIQKTKGETSVGKDARREIQTPEHCWQEYKMVCGCCGKPFGDSSKRYTENYQMIQQVHS